MGVIHSLSAFSQGGLAGIQRDQRDWSPYVAHFTSYEAMEDVREAISDGVDPEELQARLKEADERSFEVVENIAEDNRLKASSPPDKPELPEIVSLSESTLPGLIALAERYGRFGFVFEKGEIFKNSGRPCAYLSEEFYGLISELRRNDADEDINADATLDEMLSISNVFRPPGEGQVQDFTHEREWRYFSDLHFDVITPSMYICPEDYINHIHDLFGGHSEVLPLEVLHQWGV